METTGTSERARLASRLRRLSTERTPAIIVGNGSSNDLSFVRSLSRRHIPTIFLVADRQLGSFSRYGLRIRMPAVEEKPQAWLDTLEYLGGVLKGPPVLFALSDAHCAFVAHHASSLEHRFRFVLPDTKTMARILDKRQQYAAAARAGLSVPLTFYPDGIEDVQRLAATLHFPVILKPYTAHLGRPHIANRKVLVLQNARELITAYATCTASGVPFMIQKIVGGDDDAIFWYSGFWNERGRELASFTVQKLRQFPRGFGDGCFQETLQVSDIAEQSRRVLEAFGYRGFVMVEFKRDPTDGVYHLMEINPRTVSGNQLGITAGVDLPWIAYRSLTGLDQAPAPVERFRSGVRYVNEEWDLQAFWALRRAREMTLAGWLRSWAGTRAWALFALDDPLPLMIGLWRFCRFCVQSTARRW